MKVALILPGSIWYAPYVKIYTSILDKHGVDYSIISWNREGDDKPEGYQYNVPCVKGHGSAGWKAYNGYIKYIKKTLKEQKFERIIVFGPQLTCLLCLYLLLHFRSRFMIDYRDLSIEQRLGLKQIFALMLRFSRANVISSPGFKRCLPKRNYLISHNFDVNTVKAALLDKKENEFHYEDGKVSVLTIGGIRDYTSNIEVVKALANREGYQVHFVGKGDASQMIETYCQNNQVKNVFFRGFYQKQEEPYFILQSTFMNIFYPRIITHDTAMSNRFYNSLVYKRPMIVTKGTIQGDYVESHRIGVAIDNCSNLHDTIDAFLQSEDPTDYASRCNELLKSFLKDQEAFELAISQFVM